jgi:hypothetical protein
MVLAAVLASVSLHRGKSEAKELVRFIKISELLQGVYWTKMALV